LIIVRFRGGMGNQMFQHAFLLYLRRLGIPVKADLSEYRCMETHKGYELDKAFGISCEMASAKEIRALADYIPVMHRFPFSKQVFQYLYKQQYKKVEKNGHKKSHIEEGVLFSLEENERLTRLRSGEDMYLDGYWIYPELYDDGITDEFSFTGKLYELYKATLGKMKEKKTCSIHVRCGDYTGSALDILDEVYYKKAADHIREKRGEDVCFVLFSDDCERASAMLKKAGIEPVIYETDKRHAYDDMFLMSCCDDNITANSTYSFWGARLNKNSDKLVICPEYEDRDGSINRLAMNEWIRL
jgi:hypothetical protein